MKRFFPQQSNFKGLFWGLLTLILGVFICAPESVTAQEVYPPGAVFEHEIEDQKLPRYLEKIVEFMWLEDGRSWKDQYRARVYPREPRVNRRARINLRIRRYRGSKVRGKVNPLKVEVLIRRVDGKGLVKQVIKNPGPSISFDYNFERTGNYVVSLVTYQAEQETYTMALRFQVLPEAPAAVKGSDPDDIE